MLKPKNEETSKLVRFMLMTRRAVAANSLTPKPLASMNWSNPREICFN